MSPGKPNPNHEMIVDVAMHVLCFVLRELQNAAPPRRFDRDIHETMKKAMQREFKIDEPG